MKKLSVKEIIVVEGKYDAVKLANLVDTLVISTGGFSIFTSQETRDLIINLGKKHGVVVLTDSDAAGFQIRNYIEKFAGVRNIEIKHAYIPAQKGKEQRKAKPAKEGLLGVEGIDDETILNALKNVCTEKAQSDNNLKQAQKNSARKITHTDLYELGISGTQGSAQRKRELLRKLGLPPRLSKKAMCAVLNSLYSYEEFAELVGC